MEREIGREGYFTFTRYINCDSAGSGSGGQGNFVCSQNHMHQSNQDKQFSVMSVFDSNLHWVSCNIEPRGRGGREGTLLCTEELQATTTTTTKGPFALSETMANVKVKRI